MNTADTFWNKVAKVCAGDDDCWVWLGGTDKDGYGKIRFEGRHQRAHRVAWSIENGKSVPEGMVILHRCDNPQCVRPSHLSAGTHAENVADCFGKGRRAVGEESPNAKMTNAQAKYARHLYFAERHTHKALSEFFEVSTHAIKQIVQGRTYRRASCPALHI